VVSIGLLSLAAVEICTVSFGEAYLSLTTSGLAVKCDFMSSFNAHLEIDEFVYETTKIYKF